MAFRSLPAPPDLPPTFIRLFAWLKDLVTVLGKTQQGKLNCAGSVTLTANAASTTLNDPRIGAESVILFMPTTANAAAEATSLYITGRDTGTCTINHANDADADKTFDYIVIG